MEILKKSKSIENKYKTSIQWAPGIKSFLTFTHILQILYPPKDLNIFVAGSADG